MSEEELIEGYIQGCVTRRVFVRRLMLGGLSFSAAMAYGNALASGAAVASPSHPNHEKHEKHDNDDRHRRHHKP